MASITQRWSCHLQPPRCTEEFVRVTKNVIPAKGIKPNKRGSSFTRLYTRTKIEGSLKLGLVCLCTMINLGWNAHWESCQEPGNIHHREGPSEETPLRKTGLHGVNRKSDSRERHSFTGYPQAQNLLVPLNTVGSILIYFPFCASENKVQLIYEPTREKVMTPLNA